MRAAWKVMLDGAREEALLGVDLYNQPRQPRRLEAFFVHMHIAWLYLLHAEFKRDGVDFRYHLSNGRLDRVDGEPKTWDLARCVGERWPADGPVRKNLELTIALRNKIEHRYHEAIMIVASGYAQALLINFEEELVSAFGSESSLGADLRFPIFVGSITPLGQAKIDELRQTLPKNTKDFIARFESGLDTTITSDQHYEFRVHLVPKLGPKDAADRAVSFVRDADLTDEQRQAFQSLGRSGSVVVREQIRPVAGAGMMKPTVAAVCVAQQIPFEFNINHFIQAWKTMGCRPPGGDPHPERTDEKYCVYDEPHKDYLYTNAMIDKVARETKTSAKFQAFLGIQPRPKTKVVGT